MEKSAMKTFVMSGRYTAEAIKKMSDERATKASEIVQMWGGKLVSSYATSGTADMLAIVEFPGANEATAASVALSNALGISFSTLPRSPDGEFR